jgi:hypothetical protein
MPLQTLLEDAPGGKCQLTVRSSAGTALPARVFESFEAAVLGLDAHLLMLARTVPLAALVDEPWECMLDPALRAQAVATVAARAAAAAAAAVATAAPTIAKPAPAAACSDSSAAAAAPASPPVPRRLLSSPPAHSHTFFEAVPAAKPAPPGGTLKRRRGTDGRGNDHAVDDAAALPPPPSSSSSSAAAAVAEPSGGKRTHRSDTPSSRFRGLNLTAEGTWRVRGALRPTVLAAGEPGGGKRAPSLSTRRILLPLSYFRFRPLFPPSQVRIADASGQVHEVGRYADEEQAARVYDEWAVALRGAERAHLNFPAGGAGAARAPADAATSAARALVASAGGRGAGAAAAGYDRAAPANKRAAARRTKTGLKTGYRGVYAEHDRWSVSRACPSGNRFSGRGGGCRPRA